MAWGAPKEKPMSPLHPRLLLQPGEGGAHRRFRRLGGQAERLPLGHVGDEDAGAGGGQRPGEAPQGGVVAPAPGQAVEDDPGPPGRSRAGRGEPGGADGLIGALHGERPDPHPTPAGQPASKVAQGPDGGGHRRKAGRLLKKWGELQPARGTGPPGLHRARGHRAKRGRLCAAVTRRAQRAWATSAVRLSTDAASLLLATTASRRCPLCYHSSSFLA
jgi:hypothetical protein